jgi:choline dehydrogenase-like flavoprotein
MIDDLRGLQDGAELEADLCVVGAGAAGISLAREFLGTGTSVLVLESGGRRRSRLGNILNEAESTGLDPASLTNGRERILGGTTALWAGQCLEPEPSTFAERDWVPFSGWPFDERELEPVLRRAEALFQIEGEAYDERVWDAFRVERPEVDSERILHRFTVWCPHPHLGRLYRRELERASNVRVLLHATTTAISTSPAGDRFESLRVMTPEGKTATVRARACVVCAGAVENARLLLASNNVHSAGLGNAHDLVGRFFQDHPNSHGAVVLGGDNARLQELYGLLYRGRLRYLPRMVLTPEVERSQRVLACAAYPVFHYGEESGMEAARRIYRSVKGRRRPERLARELTRISRDVCRLVPVAYRRVARGRSARLPPQVVTLQIHAEQAPNPDSRVTLSQRRNRLGEPLPRVDWRLTELDRRTAQVMIETVAGEFRRAGLGEVRAEPWLGESSWSSHVNDAYHQMGTTRLGRDPQTSVVDPQGQVHGVAGLFVTGASVFPAAGFANPTLTIAALAIRLGDHLKSRLAELPAGAP